MKKWYETKEADSDVVLSTRVRLARNIEEYPFPSRLDDDVKQELCRKIRDCLLAHSELGLKYMEMNQLTEKQAVSLAERHLISPEFASPRKGRALLLNDDESVSIMLMEDDHIKIQVIKGGLNTDSAFEVANKIDDIINENFTYAFDERIGYLTENPTNLGTAMRVSVMVHLPAISKCGRMSQLAATLTRLGLIVRGIYGDSNSSNGDIYQISNNVSLGLSEKNAMDNLKQITMQIATQERNAAEKLVKNVEIVDKIQRAYGILSSARLLSTREMLELFSLVRLGAVYKIIDADLGVFGELMDTMQPASLCVINNKDMTSAERDEVRANTVRERLFAK